MIIPYLHHHYVIHTALGCGSAATSGRHRTVVVCCTRHCAVIVCGRVVSIVLAAFIRKERTKTNKKYDIVII